MQKTTQVYDLTAHEQGQGGLGASEVTITTQSAIISGKQTTVSYQLKVAEERNKVIQLQVRNFFECIRDLELSGNELQDFYDTLKSIYPGENIPDNLLSDTEALQKFILSKHNDAGDPVQAFLEKLQPELMVESTKLKSLKSPWKSPEPWMSKHLKDTDTVTFAFTFDNAGNIFCKNMYINKDQPDKALTVEKRMQLPHIGMVSTHNVREIAQTSAFEVLLDTEYERFQQATINGKPYSHYIAVSQQGVQALQVEQSQISAPLR